MNKKSKPNSRITSNLPVDVVDAVLMQALTRSAEVLTSSEDMSAAQLASLIESLRKVRADILAPERAALGEMPMMLVNIQLNQPNTALTTSAQFLPADEGTDETLN